MTIIARLRERNASLPPFNPGSWGLLEPPTAPEADEVVVIEEGDRPTQVS